MTGPALDWYPGLMARTQRFLDRYARRLDCFLEITDARSPSSARWPGLAALIGSKPRVLVLNKVDLASPEVTRQWQDHLQMETPGVPVLPLAAGGVSGSAAARWRRNVLEAVYACVAAAGEPQAQPNRPVKVAAVGIPNVGKSTVLNLLAGSRRAATGARPGLTRGQQWLVASERLWLLDLPGVLPPFLRRPGDVGRLALIGAAPDGAYDEVTAALFLLDTMLDPGLGPGPASTSSLLGLAPDLPTAPGAQAGATATALLQAFARRRGLLLPGGVEDTRRAASVLIAEFRRGSLGRISLERPPDRAEPLPC